MKTVGIVCEYNPMHTGHAYQLQMARKRGEATHCVCVMSGNFVQRSQPAILNKWTRAHVAATMGADLVLELPTIYAMGSAERFASGAIRTLHAMQVDAISFGCETEDVAFLQSVAQLIQHPTPDYQKIMENILHSGGSFIQAREEAISTVLHLPREKQDLLHAGGVILGIEYLRVMLQLNWTPQVIAIKRVGNEHNSEQDTGDFLSATAIRKILAQIPPAISDHISPELITKRGENPDGSQTRISATEILAPLRKYLPDASYNAVFSALEQGRLYTNNDSAENPPVIFDQFDSKSLTKRGEKSEESGTLEKMLYLKLIGMNSEQLRQIADVGEGLENAILKETAHFRCINQICSDLSSRRYPATRIRRVLMNILLGITKTMQSRWSERLPFMKILAMTEEGQNLLHSIMRGKNDEDPTPGEIHTGPDEIPPAIAQHFSSNPVPKRGENSGIVFLTNPGAQENQLSESSREYLAQEAAWTDLYQLLIPNRDAYERGLEYRMPAQRISNCRTQNNKKQR